MFSRTTTSKSTGDCWDKTDYQKSIDKLKKLFESADAFVIGAGAGLSTSAGFTYSGERFEKYFSDFSEKYFFKDMYSGGFYPYETAEEYWAYWSRYIYINRFMNPPKPVYHRLFELVRDKDYFVLTTNVDHCFQKNGFDKLRLFYTQGDYGLFQCSQPCHNSTYDNESIIREMVQAQGYAIDENGALIPPKGHSIDENGSLIPPERQSLQMKVPSDLVPHCPKCGRPMTMNLRADDTFVEDEGWHRAAERYAKFLRRHENAKVLFLDLAVGFNTPGIIKYPFWQMTNEWQDAAYACLNYGEAFAPDEIAAKSVVIDGDIGEILAEL